MNKILIVCSGNTCRSPIAEFVLRTLINERNLEHKIHVDSAGTEVNHNATLDARAHSVLKKHCIPHQVNRKSKKVADLKLEHFDYILAMERQHLKKLQAISADDKRFTLLLSDAFANGDANQLEVSDPWGDGKYDEAFELIRIGCEAFLGRLIAENRT
jgi:protein-tyrosine phosphatase